MLHFHHLVYKRYSDAILSHVATLISCGPLPCPGAKVSIDEATAARIKKESPAPNAFKAEDVSSKCKDTKDREIPIEELRAACVTILAGLSNGRSGIRLQVCLVPQGQAYAIIGVFRQKAECT